MQMSNWQRHVYLNPEWEKAKDGEISHQELAAALAKKLRALRPFKSELDDLNDELAELVDEFEALAENSDTGADDIDSVMHSLYNWGDQRLDGDWNGKKVCWIDSITSRA
jgi:hypothetical protein